MDAKGQLTLRESGSESEKGQRTGQKDQRINGKTSKQIFNFARSEHGLSLLNGGEEGLSF